MVGGSIKSLLLEIFSIVLILKIGGNEELRIGSAVQVHYMGRWGCSAGAVQLGYNVVQLTYN